MFPLNVNVKSDRYLGLCIIKIFKSSIFESCISRNNASHFQVDIYQKEVKPSQRTLVQSIYGVTQKPRFFQTLFCTTVIWPYQE